MASHTDLRPGIDFIGITTPFYCNDGKGNFVLHRRSGKSRDEQGRWDFGSGQLDFGEEVEKGVLRELYEEYGVDGTIQEQIPAHSILREHNGVKTHWIAIPFFVLVDTSRVRIMEPEKHTEIAVFPYGSFPEPFHTGAQITMSRFQHYFDKYGRK